MEDPRVAYTIRKLEDNGLTDCSECGHRPDYIEWFLKVVEAASLYKKEETEDNKKVLFDAVAWEYDYD